MTGVILPVYLNDCFGVREPCFRDVKLFLLFLIIGICSPSTSSASCTTPTISRRASAVRSFRVGKPRCDSSTSERAASGLLRRSSTELHPSCRENCGGVNASDGIYRDECRQF